MTEAGAALIHLAKRSAKDVTLGHSVTSTLRPRRDLRHQIASRQPVHLKAAAAVRRVVRLTGIANAVAIDIDAH